MATTGNILRGFLAGLAVLLLIARAVPGSETTVVSTVSAEQVSMNDRLELTIVIAGPDARKAAAPKLDPMPGFHIVGSQQSTEYQFSDGKSTTLITYIYELMPRNMGTHKVGGASVAIGGRVLTTQESTVRVVANSPAPSPSRPLDDLGQAGKASGGDDIFIRTMVDNRKPYVGEQITLTFELFNRLALWGDTEYNPPSTTGFWKVDLPRITPSTRNIKNMIYKHNAIKTALFPTTAGRLEIGPASLMYTTGGFFNPRETKTLVTAPITIQANPLPENDKPADFRGAVGNFRIKSESDKSTLRAGDVATIVVTVSGEGNLDLLASVTEPDFSAFRTYEPKITTQILNSGFTVGGAKVWEYVLMPRSPGAITLRPFSLPYFNPKTGKYHTVSAEPITLVVTPGDPALASGGNARDTRGREEKIADDINYIKPDKRTLASVDRRLYLNPLFSFFYLFPGVIFAAALIIKRRHDAIERNSGLKRKLNAWRNARERLDKAVRAESEGGSAEFRGYLSEAVVRFIGDRLNTDAGALTTTALEGLLRNAGVPPETAARVRKMLEMCDFVRFSSAGTGPDIRKALLADAREILTTLRDMI